MGIRDAGRFVDPFETRERASCGRLREERIAAQEQDEGAVLFGACHDVLGAVGVLGEVDGPAEVGVGCQLTPDPAVTESAPVPDRGNLSRIATVGPGAGRRVRSA